MIHLPEATRKRRLLQELGLKAEAELLLRDRNPRLVIPTEDEWIGLNLLQRDGELPHGQHAALALR